ncbi:MAG: serine/threonine-protein kinase [Bryobacteraceae bacterium]
MQFTGEGDVCPKCEWRHGSPAQSTMYLDPGFVLKEQYLVGRCLGAGGFGITYLGWDLNLARRIAIKEYFPSGVGVRATGDPRVFAHSPNVRNDYDWGLERYLEEARVVAQFENHPNIVAVKNYFPANGTAYMVLEHLDGITFEEFLARSGGKVNWDMALRVMTPVMDALREVHKAGLLHRDISPDNIFVLWSGQIKVIDFGAARYSMGQQSRNISVILKPGFAPPEQYETRGDQRPWTDVYAVAATMYRSITGEMPLPAPDRYRHPLPTPSSLGAGIGDMQERALLQALALEPEKRFATMEAFQRALRGEAAAPAPAPDPKPAPPVAKTEPSPTKPPLPSPAPPKPAPVGGFPKWLAAVAGVVFALVAAAVFWPRGGGAPASIEYFRADRETVRAGESAKLTWSVKDATQVYVGGLEQPSSGTMSVSPEETTAYSLVAMNKAGRQERVLRVTVAPRNQQRKEEESSNDEDRPNDQTNDERQPVTAGPKILSFEVSPTTVTPGAEARLHWSVIGANQVKIGSTKLPPSGSAPVRVQASTRYTLRATSSDGRVAEQSLVLNVAREAPPARQVEITRFGFTPPVVSGGQSARLDWSVQNATSVRINNRQVDHSGSTVVRMPTQPISAEIVAEGAGGPVRRTATLSVQSPSSGLPSEPVITQFTLSPSRIYNPGQIVTITYATRNAVRVEITPEVGNLTSTQGRVTVFPKSTTTYTMTAFDARGRSQTRTAAVDLIAANRYDSSNDQRQYRNQPAAPAWRVYHHHGSAMLSGFPIDFGQGRSSANGCYGTLTLNGKNLTFFSNSNDGFNINVDTIAEASQNRLRLGGHVAFHIKMNSGENYNFVPQVSANTIIGAIRRAQ